MTPEQFKAQMTDEQMLYFFDLICYVENGGADFTSINTVNNAHDSDPFTLGCWSWTGPQCWDLLDMYKTRYPAVWADMPADFKTWYQEGRTGYHFGFHPVLTQAIEDEWKRCCSLHYDDIKAGQLWMIFDGDHSGGFLSELRNLFNGAYYPDTFDIPMLKGVFAGLSMSMLGGYWTEVYEQFTYPDYTLACNLWCYLEQVNWPSGWNSFGAGWRNRFDYVINMLNNWDGTSYSGEYIEFSYLLGGNKNPDAPSAGGAEFTSIDLKGGTAILHFASGNTLAFYKHPDGSYRPAQSTTSPDGQTSGDITGNDALFIEYVTNIINQEKYAYTYQDGGSTTHPWESGTTDCSGWIISLALRIAPWSDLAQYENGLATCDWTSAFENVWSGKCGDSLPYGIMRPGDCIVEFSNSQRADGAGYKGHVELFLGTTAQGNKTGYELWGAGVAPAPNPGGLGYGYSQAQTYYDNGGCFSSPRNLYIVRPHWGTLIPW